MDFEWRYSAEGVDWVELSELYRIAPLGDKDPIVGAVGRLQFEVLTYRLEHEYGVVVTLEPMPYQTARWLEGEGLTPNLVNSSQSTLWVNDREERPVILFASEWAVRLLAERNENITLRDIAA